MITHVNWLTKILAFKPLRFFLVGGLNTLVGYSVFAVLVFIGMQSSLALLCTTCFGVFFNFKTISGIAFSTNNNRLFFKFIVLYALLYLTNLGLLKALDNWVQNTYYSGLISMLLTAIPGYYGNKFLFSNTGVRATPRNVF